jgi:C4-dicarboxylate-specific signal transduction histidine kinase
MRHGVHIVIADKGSGIFPAVAAKAFEAFFTTKEMKGTGLASGAARAAKSLVWSLGSNSKTKREA